VGILLGLLTIFWPGITFAGLIVLFGAYALIDGIINIAGAVRAIEARDRWGALLFEGIVGILAAAATIMWPGITALALVFVIAAWAIITGIAEIVAAIRLRTYISGEWLLVLSGIASLVFGVLVAAAPRAGALVIALWLGAYAFVFGVLLVALGFRLRSWERALPAGPPITAHAH
jgi:uncharacterized membrane protein HdeD (DUF308 family)